MVDVGKREDLMLDLISELKLKIKDALAELRFIEDRDITLLPFTESVRKKLL